MEKKYIELNSVKDTQIFAINESSGARFTPKHNWRIEVCERENTIKLN